MLKLILRFFGSPVFTWWNSATFGTLLFTKRKGQKVGEDSQGNTYYQEKNGTKRWVIYKNGPVEASRVPPEWHGWLHYTVDKLPSENDFDVNTWEKDHIPNLTGTAAAYVPSGSMKATGKRAKTTSDYEAWKPGQS